MSEERPLGLTAELKRRCIKPWSSTTFKLYFFGAIMGYGGLGIWLPNCIKLSLHKQVEWTSLPNDLCVYAIAIIATASVDVLLPKNLSRPLIILVSLTATFAVIFTLLAMLDETIIGATLLTIIGLLFWWIAKADDEMFSDNPEQIIKNALGDQHSAPQAGKNGLEGYKH